MLRKESASLSSTCAESARLSLPSKKTPDEIIWLFLVRKTSSVLDSIPHPFPPRFFGYKKETAPFRIEMGVPPSPIAFERILFSREREVFSSRWCFL